MTTTVEFEVVGEDRIHCQGCESRIAAGLGRLRGVEQVQASAQTQRVRVAIDPSAVTADEVRARLVQLGYQVR